MKRKPFNPQGVSSFLIIFAICAISTIDAAAAASKGRRNHKNFSSESSGSRETFMTGETGSRQEILADVGDTVYIGCALNRTNAYGCEWYKWGPQGGNKKRITQFVGRYQRIEACQLQIRSVTYDDGGSIICKVVTDSSEPSFHINQLTVTGQDDPSGNILLKPEAEVANQHLPYAEPEIMMESSAEDRLYKRHSGENFRLKCEASGNPKPFVFWRRGSKNYTALTEGYSYLELTNLTKDDSGVYKCEAVNIFGKVVQDIRLEVRGALQGASEIIEVTPRNVSLYEGSYGNITCIARFEGDPWFVWVKKIDNKTAEVNAFSYEGHYYSVLQRTEIRPLGQHLYSTTLLLQNVTIGSSGVYHCIVAGLQGYNHSEAYVMVEQDPANLHIAQIRKHKTVAMLWIFSFVIFAALVVLCVIRIYGCPSTSTKKVLSSTSSIPSDTTSSHKTQLPKRSPETMSTDCTNNPQHEVFAPLMKHGSCSLASHDASLVYKSYSPSCRTYNSYDPECSYDCSSPDSVLMASLEAARSSNSHTRAESCNSEHCSHRSVTSPITQTSDYYTTHQLNVTGSRSPQDLKPEHLHKHQHHHHVYPEGNEKYNYPSHYHQPTIHYHPQLQVLNHVCSCTEEYCRCHTPSYDIHSSSNLSVSTDCDSQWHSENTKPKIPPPRNFRVHRHHQHSVEDDNSYSLDEDDDLESCSRATDQRFKLNPSPTSNLSFFEHQLRPNNRHGLSQIAEMRDINKGRVPLVPFL